MADLPYAARTPGFSQAITDTTTSDAIAVPEGATEVVLYFEDGAGGLIEGRVAFSTDGDGITVTDTNMMWHPPIPIQSGQQARYTVVSGTKTHTQLYLHVACATAGAIAKGGWMFRTEG